MQGVVLPLCDNSLPVQPFNPCAIYHGKTSTIGQRSMERAQQVQPAAAISGHEMQMSTRCERRPEAPSPADPFNTDDGVDMLALGEGAGKGVWGFLTQTIQGIVHQQKTGFIAHSPLLLVGQHSL